MNINNVNLSTGVPYGYISANALDPDLVDDLMYNPGATNHTYDEAYRYAYDCMKAEWCATNPGQNPDDFDDTIHDMVEREYGDTLNCDEPIVEGRKDNVHYLSSWLGGALNFFIIESPVITERARRASPCVPGAAILDTLDGSERGYDVPEDWRAVQ